MGAQNNICIYRVYIYIEYIYIYMYLFIHVHGPNTLCDLDAKMSQGLGGFPVGPNGDMEITEGMVSLEHYPKRG